MQIRPETLESNLSQSLLPVYIVTGDETLIVEEACAAIISAAKAQGYIERKILDVVAGFDWSALFVIAGTGSLFAEREMIDLRIPSKKFDKATSTALRSYLDNPPEDVMLLIRTQKLDGRQKSNAWYKAIDKMGGVVTVWPVDAAHLPQWIVGRARKLNMQLERDAVSFLANRTEGNLLALHQELDKLKLWSGSTVITLAEVQKSVADSAHFDAFELINATLQGRGKRVIRILHTLEHEGIAPLAILGAFKRQIDAILHGSKMRLPREAQQSIDAARRRLSDVQLKHFIAETSLLDQQVKGMLTGDIWQSLERLLLEVAGYKTTPRLSLTHQFMKRW